jgi:hypothetical protein
MNRTRWVPGATGYQLCIDCTILGQGRNLEEPLPLFFLVPSPKAESKLCYNCRSVGRSILISSSHLGPKTRFLLLSGSCGFVYVVNPLWQEDKSVICNCCWSLAAQSFSTILASNHYVSCHMLVTGHRALIGNWLYWTLVTTGNCNSLIDLCTTNHCTISYEKSSMSSLVVAW